MIILVRKLKRVVTGEQDWIPSWLINFRTHWSRILVCNLDPLSTQNSLYPVIPPTL